MSDFQLIMYIIGIGFCSVVILSIFIGLILVTYERLYNIIVSDDLKEYIQYKKNNRKDNDE